MTVLTKQKSMWAAAVAIAINFLAGPAFAGDPMAGKEKSAICAACHGADGKTPLDPSYAILAGQHETYLVVALKAYRSGRRQHAVMGAQAKQLSSDDIYNLAAYYSSLPGPLGYKR